MSIINNAHGGSQYAVLAAFYQVLKASPKNQLPREKLMALCAPETLQTGDSQNARGKASQELRAWLDLGLLTEEKVEETTQISFNANYFSTKSMPLRQAARRCLQAQENNSDLSSRDERAVDLTLLAALLLALDVYQNAEIKSGNLEVLVNTFIPDFRINSNEIAVVPGISVGWALLNNSLATVTPLTPPILFVKSYRSLCVLANNFPSAKCCNVLIGRSRC